MTQEVAVKAMELADAIHKTNSMNLKGKKYTQVVHRIEAFRRTVGYDYGIETSIQQLNGGYTGRAEIKDANGRIIATGCSFVDKLAKEKALEKLETVAVGRALANLGLGGGEYASLDEIDSYEERYTPETKAPEKYFKDAKDAKNFQFQLINQINTCGSREQLDNILNGQKEGLDALADGFFDLYETLSEYIDNARSSTFDGNAKPYVKFANVSHALTWMGKAKDELDELKDPHGVRQWVADNTPYLEILDKTLAADKYLKDGKTPSQRLEALIQQKLQKEAA